jgi:hypothetical protein
MNRGIMVMEASSDNIREAGRSLEDVFLSVTGLDEEIKDILKGLE